MTNDLRILVTGVGGQVGHSLLRALKPLGTVLGTDIKPPPDAPETVPLDLCHSQSVLSALSQFKPDIIVNPAAYTAVDKAETDRELALAINKEAPRILAQYCYKHTIPLIHYSTDYVFSGEGKTPWTEEDATSPVNYYGLTKLAGENEIVASQAHYVILRTSWVFSDHGANFVKTMLHLASSRSELKIVSDQIGAPTSADFLAEMTAVVIKKGLSDGFKDLAGVYHLSNSGETSWFEFAKKIFDLALESGKNLEIKNVYPIRTEEYPTPARRPKNSRLNCNKFKKSFGLGHLEDWEQALIKVTQKLFGKNL